MEPQELQESQPAKSLNVHALVTSVPLAILVAAAMISGSILSVGSGGSRSAVLGGSVASPAPENDAPPEIPDPSVLSSARDASLGSEKARVTIVEFSDFQCPFCRNFFTNTFSQLKKQYIDTGKVRLVFRHYPLSFHPAARPSALAAECAADQGKFWQFHDKVFAEQEKKGTGTITYGVPELKTWAAQIGLNKATFDTCLDTEKYASKVDADSADGAKYGVSGTPSFFVNGKLLVGAQPLSDFQSLIDSEL